MKATKHKPMSMTPTPIRVNGDNSDYKTVQLLITARYSDTPPDGIDSGDFEDITTDKNFTGYVIVDTKLSSGEKVFESSRTPEQFLADGFLVGFLEMVQVNLSGDRGVTFKSASEDAKSRADEAAMLLERERLMELLLKMKLAVCKPEGAA